jgi:branched-chain amino acid transport system permease protein
MRAARAVPHAIAKRALRTRTTMTAAISVLIDGIIYASYLFVIAVGLTLIYGVMKILNMAHGSLYALGAYVAATLVGAWFTAGLNPYGSFALLALSALLVGAVAGPVIERGLLRFMYGKDEIVLILVTYSVFLILEDLIKLVWGVESYAAYQPYGLLGNFDVAGLPYTVYDALLVLIAILVGVAVTFVLTRTRQGKLLIAVIHDREVSAAMGINVQRVYFVTFTIGTMLAALGGALIAPKVSVVPAMGVEVIVLAFAVVVIGGLGSLPGAALGAVIVGLVRSAAVHYLPEVELFSIYLVMALVLIVRPKGLFSAPEARKI